MAAFDFAFKKMIEAFLERIRVFAAFMFLLFVAGAVFGFIATTVLDPVIIVIPAALGLIAYYNTTFAVISLILLIIFFLI